MPDSTPHPTLYLIDGYAQFFRCYHAIRTPMTSPVTKEPTNMIFGFVGMLLKLLRGEGPAMQAWGGPPTYMALALDIGGDYGTFRSQLYPDYKKNRNAPPEDLFPQVERCLAMLEHIGVPVIGKEGFEADDVFATLIKQLREQHPDLRIRMVTKDKDLKQLLDIGPAGHDAPSHRVELFDVHTDMPFSADSLMQDTGLRPDQVVDMLALMGDTSDNVPGVEGVGEKTAAMLIKEYGTLDALLARAGEIKGKRGEKLRESTALLALSKQLVSLRYDVPVSLDLSGAKTDAFKVAKLIPFCQEMGFNRYQDDVRRLLGESPVMPLTSGSVGARHPDDIASSLEKTPRKPTKRATDIDGIAAGGLFASAESTKLDPPSLIRAQSGAYHAVTTLKDLRALAGRMSRAAIFAIDTETTSLVARDAKLCGVSIAITPGEAFYIPTRTPTPSAHLDTDTVLRELRGVLEDTRVPKCGHNIKYDLLVFRAHGLRLALGQRSAEALAANEHARGAFDSMVASYLIDASRSSHGMDALALALLQRTNISISQLIGSGKDQRSFDTVPLAQAVEYAAEDADVTLQLHNAMLPQLRAMGLMGLFADVEMPLVDVLAELEWNGVMVDPKELAAQRSRLEKQIETIRAKIDQEAKKSLFRTFDLDSPKQLAAALFGKETDEPPGLGLKGLKRTKTGFSTDAEVLEELAEDPKIATPIPAQILEYRQLTKLVSTYLVALADAIHPSTKRIHCTFHQTVAATGRLACSDPNLQNIPIRTDVGREIRKAFIAPPGRVLVTADYSQIELRLLAHLSRDPALIDAFLHDADIHTAVAAQIANIKPEEVSREQRSGAKMVNFGIVYGITAYGLARRLKVEQDKAQEIITGYKKRFAGITTFLQECVEQAQRTGHVTTILGRRRPIPDIDSTNPSRRALAERLAINSVVQGSAADLIKLAMVRVEEGMRAARPDVNNPLASAIMLLQIHDELVLECALGDADAVKKFASREMEGAMLLLVPLKADASVGKNWFEGKA